MPVDVVADVRGERLHLLPERAVWWDRAATLVVADLHWGKAATFRAAGIAIPPGATADDLRRLDSALRRTAARRLIVLGDLFHARAGRRSDATLAELRRWRTGAADIEILLVRGNHDRRAGDPPAELGIACVDPPVDAPPFALHHEARPEPGRYTLAGHVHPGVTLRGAGRQRERLPCFVVGPTRMILPAFGSFTGTAELDDEAEDRRFVIADDEVLAVG